MVAGNLYALQNFFGTNWSTKWCAKPTFKALELKSGDETGDHLFYSGGKPVETPVGNGWIDRKEPFKFLLRSTTSGNVELMFEELKYCVNNLFYPAPFTPVSHESEVLAYYDCNHASDNTGGAVTLYDYQTTYDMTFGAAGAAPSWVTTGALNRKQFVRCGDGDNLYNGTLLDTMPSALTIEILCRTAANNNNLIIDKENVDTNDRIMLELNTNDDFASVVFNKFRAGVEKTAYGGWVPLNKWFSLMATAGPRGMELYLNGELIAINIDTNLITNGTHDHFYVNGKNSNFDLSVLRVSNVQRLPWDPQSLTLALKDVAHGPGYYQAECEIIGELKNIYVGGNI